MSAAAFLFPPVFYKVCFIYVENIVLTYLFKALQTDCNFYPHSSLQFYCIIPASTTLAIIPAAVASKAPVSVWRVFLTLAVIK